MRWQVFRAHEMALVQLHGPVGVVDSQRWCRFRNVCVRLFLFLLRLDVVVVFSRRRGSSSVGCWHARDVLVLAEDLADSGAHGIHLRQHRSQANLVMICELARRNIVGITSRHQGQDAFVCRRLFLPVSPDLL